MTKMRFKRITHIGSYVGFQGPKIFDRLRGQNGQIIAKLYALASFAVL